MCDLLVLAFQADVTRVCTFVLRQRGQQQAVPVHRRVGRAPRPVAPRQRRRRRRRRSATSTASTSTQLAYLLDEAEGHQGRRRHAARSLHDRLRQRQLATATPTTTTTCRSCWRAAGCGTLKTGRHLRYPKETPLNNLWLSMLDRMKVKVPLSATARDGWRIWRGDSHGGQAFQPDLLCRLAGWVESSARPASPLLLQPCRRPFPCL